MSLRKIASFDNPTLKLRANVYRDAEYDEYRVRFYRGHEHQINADYHTDDKQDALDTAKLFSNGRG